MAKYLSGTITTTPPLSSFQPTCSAVRISLLEYVCQAPISSPSFLFPFQYEEDLNKLNDIPKRKPRQKLIMEIAQESRQVRIHSTRQDAASGINSHFNSYFLIPNDSTLECQDNSVKLVQLWSKHRVLGSHCWRSFDRPLTSLSIQFAIPELPALTVSQHVSHWASQYVWNRLLDVISLHCADSCSGSAVSLAIFAGFF